MTRYAAKIRVSYRDLTRALGLPDGQHIEIVVPQTAEAIFNREVCFVIKGPGLPEVGEREALLEVEPQRHVDPPPPTPTTTLKPALYPWWHHLPLWPHWRPR